jgi:uncharacterized protein (TIGR03083 family)
MASTDGLDLIEVLAAEGAAVIAAVRQGPRDAPVAACPGWDVTALAGHVGKVWGWARRIVEQRLTEPAGYDPEPQLEPERAVAFLESELVPLLDTLRATPTDTPVWGFGPQPRTAAFWSRRQSMETLVHRIDAERAIGVSVTVEPAVGSEGVSEFLDVILPRLYRQAGRPPGQLRVELTDTGDVWAHGDPAGGVGILRGTGQDLLLALWRRGTFERIERGGDLPIVDGWTALGAL